eukprot:COSAG02_NODE_14_length_56855_cov_512.793661_18_plen_43_part_00
MVVPCEPLVAIGRRLKISGPRDLDGLIEEARRQMGLEGEVDM